MKNQFRDVPEKYYPNEDDHKDFNVVYRGIKTSIIYPHDFYPNFATVNSDMILKLRRITCKSDCSVSLHLNIDYLENRLKFSHRYFAKGKTSNKRGVSILSDSDGHIHYFLYDYIDNNPYTDFEII